MEMEMTVTKGVKYFDCYEMWDSHIKCYEMWNILTCVCECYEMG